MNNRLEISLLKIVLLQVPMKHSGRKKGTTWAFKAYFSNSSTFLLQLATLSTSTSCALLAATAQVSRCTRRQSPDSSGHPWHLYGQQRAVHGQWAVWIHLPDPQLLPCIPSPDQWQLNEPMTAQWASHGSSRSTASLREVEVWDECKHVTKGLQVVIVLLF